MDYLIGILIVLLLLNWVARDARAKKKAKKEKKS